MEIVELFCYSFSSIYTMGLVDLGAFYLMFFHSLSKALPALQLCHLICSCLCLRSWLVSLEVRICILTRNMNPFACVRRWVFWYIDCMWYCGRISLLHCCQENYFAATVNPCSWLPDSSVELLVGQWQKQSSYRVLERDIYLSPLMTSWLLYLLNVGALHESYGRANFLRTWLNVGALHKSYGLNCMHSWRLSNGFSIFAWKMSRTYLAIILKNG